MSTRLQWLLIIGSLIFFIFMMISIRKNRISTDYATIWIFLGMFLIVISIFPQLIMDITKLLGLIAPVNTVFLLMIFILFTLVFYLYIKNSLLEDKVKKIIQELSILEQNDHENNNKKNDFNE